MESIIAISIVRFNHHNSQQEKFFMLSNESTLENTKQALLSYFEEHKSDIIDAYQAVYEKDDIDGFENDRTDVYESILENIKNIQAIERINRFWTLNDGIDEDSGEDIFSNIRIKISPVTKL